MRSGFNWKAGSFFIGYHAILFLTLPFYLVYHPPGAPLVLCTSLLIVACGVTLTTLYHRHYSHRAFTLNIVVELILLFFGTVIAQGSVLEWVADHRLHHKHTDTPRDPHAISRGFWYAHVLWILEKRPPLDEDLVSDLAARRLLRFQHEHYNALLFVSTAMCVAGLAWLSGDLFGAIYFGVLVRIFISHHSTFCINSLAHYWGSKPFDPDQSAVNNTLCSLITFGEGEHNYHHVFPYDYRIGDRWYHWDPGKWLIWMLAQLGLARGLKRARASWVLRKRTNP